MHLGNGAITPGCAAVGFAAATAGLGLAAVTIRKMGLDRRQMLTAGVLGAGVFAAQMINVSILPFSSAHLVGGVLLAWVLGPALGALTMAVVLALQALLLGDGGAMALGVNVINMGLMPAGLVAVARYWLKKDAGLTGRALTAGGLGGLAVFAAAGLILGEVYLFRTPGQLTGFAAFAGQMLGIHAVIALAEAVLTVGLLSVLSALTLSGEIRLSRPRLVGTGLVSLGLVTLALPLASRMPDGYEASAERSGMGALTDGTAIASLGQINAQVAAWQEGINGAIAGLLGVEMTLALAATVLAGGLVLMLAMLLGRDKARLAGV